MKANPFVDIKNMGIKDKRVEFWILEESEKFAYYEMEYPQYYYAYYFTDVDYELESYLL